MHSEHACYNYIRVMQVVNVNNMHVTLIRPVASNFELVRPGSRCGFGQEVGVASYHKNVIQYS